MSDFKYKPKQLDDVFEYRGHRNREAKAFLKYLLSKGIITVSTIKEALNETNEAATTAIAESMDAQADGFAVKLDMFFSKVIK